MYGPDELLLVSKKPRIKELIKRSRSMTEEEIKSLPERPDVIRGLLLINLFGEDQKKATIAEKVADLMQKNHVSQPTGNSRSCHISIITSDDTWLPIGSMTLEIKNGWHWAQLADGTVYISTSATRITSDVLKSLMSMSRYITQGTLADFKELERKRLSNLVPDFIVSHDTSIV